MAVRNSSRGVILISEVRGGYSFISAKMGQILRSLLRDLDEEKRE